MPLLQSLSSVSVADAVGVEAENPERRVGPERLRERGGARSVDRVALEVGMLQCRVVGSERLREPSSPAALMPSSELSS
jgi:hypothetical protein